ncbi:MAG: hypothetical protein M0C28_36125 [Candidatus Moduliflexus flocculans]|nr:hypothetical protein [Candidatus Moduliflexus flocculans]
MYLASTFACEVDFPIKRLEFTPVAFSAVKKPGFKPRQTGFDSQRTLGLRTLIRTVDRTPDHSPLRAEIARLHSAKFSLILSMPCVIPYEGMLAAARA